MHCNAPNHLQLCTLVHEGAGSDVLCLCKCSARALTEPLLVLKTLKENKPQIHTSGGPMPAAYYFVEVVPASSFPATAVSEISRALTEKADLDQLKLDSDGLL